MNLMTPVTMIYCLNYKECGAVVSFDNPICNHARTDEPKIIAWNKRAKMEVQDADNDKECDRLYRALEQEPVLDKIRAEIEDLDRFYDNDYFSGNQDAMFKCNEVMAILDKHKAESEGEE